MSEQQPATPAPADTQQEGPDDGEPTPERQAELRAAYEADVAAGKALYAGVKIRTRGELRWIMQERRWSGEYLPLAEGYEKADLSGAHLGFANLSGAYLGVADLSGARLTDASLSGADLCRARMDTTTVLRDARLDTHVGVADVVWNGVPLTRLNWQDVTMLGDEQLAHDPRGADGKRKDKATRLTEYADAVLANRQVATVLRSQGVNEHADRFAYRAQLCQRIVTRKRRRYLRYAGSLLLDLLAGYGYRPGRAILLYLAIIVWFANFYVWASNGIITFGMPPSHVSPLAWYEALILSVSSFHGRGFQPFQNLNDPVAALAGMQAVFGLVIEVSFIATFTQRFFDK